MFVFLFSNTVFDSELLALYILNYQMREVSVPEFIVMCTFVDHVLIAALVIGWFSYFFIKSRNFSPVFWFPGICRLLWWSRGPTYCHEHWWHHHCSKFELAEIIAWNLGSYSNWVENIGFYKRVSDIFF